MINTGALVEALKRMLKARGITYARVAAGLGLSEASVKRMFSRRDFTLQRLDEVCRIVEIDLGDLLQEVTERRAQVSRLTVEQERELVSDTKLLLVALCAVGHWTLDEIVATYGLTRAEGIKYLAWLDRLKIIELQPGDRIKPLLSRTFSWLPDGPVQRHFRAHIEAEYLNWPFDGPGELLLFVNGMLSRASMTEVIARLRRVAAEFAEIHNADLSLPLQVRHGASLLLAVRPWEPRAFRSLRRQDRPPVTAGRLLQAGVRHEAAALPAGRVRRR
jgi:DNA-binding Xre family transcriptional regulator